MATACISRPSHIGAAIGQNLDSAEFDNQRPDKGGKRLIEQVREAIRTRDYSRRTGKTYWYWIRYFIIVRDGKRAKDRVTVLPETWWIRCAPT